MKKFFLVKAVLSAPILIIIIIMLSYIITNVDNYPDRIYSSKIILGDGTPCKRTDDLLVQFIREDTIWASRNLSVYKSEDQGKTFRKEFTFKPSFLSKLFIKNNPIIRELFGFEVNLKILEINPILIDINWRVYRSIDSGKSFHEVNRGITPLSQGVDVDREGNIYYGEYPGPAHLGEVRIFCSSDKGETWKTIYSFQNIRHVHSLRYDKFSDKMWITTGDLDEQCFIGYLDKIKGEIFFNSLFGGSQRYRAVSLLFDSNYVYWGMDSPYIQNFILRYNRNTKKVEEVEKINGPAYFTTWLNERLMVFGTASEGCRGEWDNKIGIWISTDGDNWERIVSLEKLDNLKKAVPFFPLGKGSILALTPHYTKHFNDDLLVFNLNERLLNNQSAFINSFDHLNYVRNSWYCK